MKPPALYPPGDSGIAVKLAFALLLSMSFACAPARPTVAVRPVIGTTYSEQHAALSAADQARLDAQCPFGRPQLRRAADFGMTYVVARDGYALEESEKDKIPVWVCERITRQQVTGSLTGGRIPFRADPLLPREARAVDADYRGSGYDRGHQAPLANQTRSQRLRDETFYLSNVVPQNSRLNQQAWAALEEGVRDWAAARDTIYSITGPLFWDPREDDPSTARGYVEYEWIGNRVSVPTHLYKIVIGRKRGAAGWEAVAFVFPNKAYDRTVDFSEFIQSVSWIQRRAGIIFFPALPSGETASVISSRGTMWEPRE